MNFNVIQRLAGCICDLSPGIPANHFRIVDVDTAIKNYSSF